MPRGPGLLGRRGSPVDPTTIAAGGGLLATTAAIGAAGGLVRPGTRTLGLIAANMSAGFNSAGNDTAGGAVGTAATVAPTATAPRGSTSLTDAGTLNAQGSIAGQANGAIWQQKPLFQCVYAPGTGSIVVVRHWVAIANTTPTSLLAVDTPGTSAFSGAGFRFSTAVPDTNWQCVTFNGASQTVVDSGVAPTALGQLRFEISDNGTSTIFKIGGVTVATITATRPAASAIVRQGAGHQTLEAVAKVSNVALLYLEQD